MCEQLVSLDGAEFRGQVEDKSHLCLVRLFTAHSDSTDGCGWRLNRLAVNDLLSAGHTNGGLTHLGSNCTPKKTQISRLKTDDGNGETLGENMAFIHAGSCDQFTSGENDEIIEQNIAFILQKTVVDAAAVSACQRKCRLKHFVNLIIQYVFFLKIQLPHS